VDFSLKNEKSLFSEQDQMVLLRLKAKQYLIENEKIIWNDFLDILFAYIYYELQTEGEESCEASWTVSRLSRCLSWLDSSIESMHESLSVSYRRFFCFNF
jgi:hypothetical protein